MQPRGLKTIGLNIFKSDSFVRDNNMIHIRTEDSALFSFFSLSFLASLIFEHYARESFWLNSCLNKECPKLLSGLGIGHRRRQTIYLPVHLNLRGGRKVLFRYIPGAKGF